MWLEKARGTVSKIKFDVQHMRKITAGDRSMFMLWSRDKTSPGMDVDRSKPAIQESEMQICCRARGSEPRLPSILPNKLRYKHDHEGWAAVGR